MNETEMNAATSPQARFFALIPCAGNGSRAGTAGPKQYERVGGQPMIWHTLSAFAGVKRIARTLVVVAQPHHFRAGRGLRRRYPCRQRGQRPA
jgi:2-C-methyl-D-erythritol 4-phosphate cytidylyltransferase